MGTFPKTWFHTKPNVLLASLPSNRTGAGAFVIFKCDVNKVWVTFVSFHKFHTSLLLELSHSNGNDSSVMDSKPGFYSLGNVHYPVDISSIFCPMKKLQNSSLHFRQWQCLLDRDQDSQAEVLCKARPSTEHSSSWEYWPTWSHDDLSGPRGFSWRPQSAGGGPGAGGETSRWYQGGSHCWNEDCDCAQTIYRFQL